MDEIVECGTCKAAFRHDIDANVRLHDHLARHPHCNAEYLEQVSAWGSATWPRLSSGAA